MFLLAQRPECKSASPAYAGRGNTKHIVSITLLNKRMVLLNVLLVRYLNNYKALEVLEDR